MSFLCWRRARDSNPRGLAPKRFSRPPRYDHFDSSPSLLIKLNILEKTVTRFATPFHSVGLRPRRLVMTAASLAGTQATLTLQYKIFG